MVAVLVEELLKRYPAKGGPVSALEGLSFTVKRGEIYGVLGPNGAGKTTLIKILATLLLPDGGRVDVLGCKLPVDERALRPRIGLSLGEFERSFHHRLTGRQNLAFFAALHGLRRHEAEKRAIEALAAVGLKDRADQLFAHYSTGMKQRLSLARALLGRPEILLLDEPTAGLDPATSVELNQLVHRIARTGTTVVYTTHRVEEAGRLCDRVLILNKGRKVAEESPQILRRLAGETQVLRLDLKVINEGLLPALRGIPGVQAVHLDDGHGLRIHLEDMEATILPIMELLREHNAIVQSIATESPGMQDVFLALTGGDA